MPGDDQTKAPRYQPSASLRFYPAARMSEERRRKIRDLELHPEDITFDDILVNTAGAYTGTFYKVMGMVEERWGPEAVVEIVRALGFRNGKASLEKWLSNHGETEGSAELMCMYEDLAHALRGPDHANAVSEYDDHRVVVTRTRCGWHTGRPENSPSYCRYFSAGAIRGYGEADPALLEVRTVTCMSYGDQGCHHEFWYSEPDEPAGETRDHWRRGDGD